MKCLLLVDEKGNPYGEGEKEKCHEGKGILHSAFLVMVFNDKDEMMLEKRSKHKKFWPNFWDGTVAGHFQKGDDFEVATRKRIYQEIGIRCREMEFLFKFRYYARYKNIGSENEICSVFLVRNIDYKHVFLNKNEVSEFRFDSIQKLKEEVYVNPHTFTPWFLIAFKKWLDVHY